MEHGIILYLEDIDDGQVRILGQVVGKPKQSKELANEIIIELLGSGIDHEFQSPSQLTH